ncbi:serine/threonine-protein kinase Smg1-like [Ostrinia furnacalis]|uniref:serine/threonine-protein kinase Smg1-like n=1 Tax=Ostrinia furnacalis TaxID=93504 RepID=UPI00103C413E|nr:serine/threonine-protein kinase Smg1-like [Ostrinia furnacalis]
MPALTDMLLDLHHAWDSGARRLTRQPALAHHAHGSSTAAWPSASTSGPGGPAGPAGGRSATGAGVWRRVRLKLEGRERDAARRAMPQEQVEYIISEATSAENLCLMYEGWMAWV